MLKGDDDLKDLEKIANNLFHSFQSLSQFYLINFCLGRVHLLIEFMSVNRVLVFFFFFLSFSPSV